MTNREWKIDIAMAIFAGMLAILAGKCALGCASDVKGAEYGASLEECNRTSKTLCESITCENYARAANGRVARALPPSCIGNDGGTVGISDAAAEGGNHVAK